MYFNNSQFRFLAAIYGLIVVLALGIAALAWLASIDLGFGFNAVLWMLVLVLMIGVGLFLLHGSHLLLFTSDNWLLGKLLSQFPDKTRTLRRSFGIYCLVMGLYYSLAATAALAFQFSIRELKLLLLVGLGTHTLLDIAVRRHCGIQSG